MVAFGVGGSRVIELERPADSHRRSLEKRYARSKILVRGKRHIPADIEEILGLGDQPQLFYGIVGGGIRRVGRGGYGKVFGKRQGTDHVKLRVDRGGYGIVGGVVVKVAAGVGNIPAGILHIVCPVYYNGGVASRKVVRRDLLALRKAPKRLAVFGICQVGIVSGSPLIIVYRRGFLGGNLGNCRRCGGRQNRGGQC